MRSWHRNLRDIGWSLAATRNEGLGPNSICSAPNLRRAPTRPEAPTTREARKRFSERNDMQAKLGTTDRRHTILIIGISRGIGRGLAAEYLRRGWFVIGTVHSSTVAPELEAMAAGMAGRLRVERIGPSEIGTLRERLADDRLDVL